MIEKINKWLPIPTLLLVLVMAVGLVGNQSTLGGSTSDDWSANSFQINGTQVISSARALAITTLSATGLVTADAGILLSSTYATSTSGNATLEVDALSGVSSLLITPTIGAIAVTLPTATTLNTLSSTVGDVIDITVVNATSTQGAASVITFAGNTGLTLQQASSTLALGGQEIAVLRLIKTGASAWIAYFSQAF